jgi:ferredoxin-NADP reductase/sterol desaturase/sphingolipid hydroxylase (fatty acid hydroxylase superfamily)
MENILTKFFEGYVNQVIWYGLWTIPTFIILWIVFKKFFANRRIQKTQKADKSQFVREIKNSLITIIIFAAIDLFVFQDSQKNLASATFKVYSNYTEHGGILYIVFITLLLFIVEDTYFYWMHKTVHSPKLYKYVHKVHHESIDTTPFTSYSFHPLEAALEIVPLGLIMAIAYLFPVHILALIIWQIGSIAFNVLGHSGYELYPSYWNNYWFLKWKLPSTHHNMHHERFNGNYGLYFIWWDRIMGTEFPDYEEKFKSIFTKTPNNADEIGYYDLQISGISNENKDAYSIYFENFPYEFRNYKAGQHVNLKVEINGEIHYRTFSLSSSPTKDKYLRLTIKRASNGLVTNYLINNLKANDTLSVSLPKGNFFVDPNPANSRTILLFAGGSGITPLFSIINTLLKEEPFAKMILFYTNENSENSIFLNELKSIESGNTNRFKLVNYFSDNSGRVSEDQILKIIETVKADEYLMCGPSGFMDLVNKTLIDSQVDISKIKFEEFMTHATHQVASDAKIVSHVTAIINKQELYFDVLENEILLDAALRQEIKIPFSCRSGMCGTCLANCLEGNVLMNENQTFLSKEAIDKSKILLCQSKSLTENITIEINS